MSADRLATRVRPSTGRRASSRRIAALALALLVGATGVVALPASAQTSPTTKIAFTRRTFTDLGQRGAIWVVDEDGTNAAALTDGSELDGTPAWSPDGARIAFARRSGRAPGIYVMDSGGTGLVRVTTDISDRFPTWSPDGTKIAFSRVATSGELDVFVVDLATGAVTQLTSAPEMEFDPAWSPDGLRISYTKDTDTTSSVTWHVFDMAVDGSGQRQISTTSSAWSDYSPNGLTIAYTSQTWPQRIVLRSADGSGDERFLASPSNAAVPSFAPDGVRVAIEHGGGTIAVLDQAGNATTVATSADGDFNPDWQPSPALEIRGLSMTVTPRSAPAGVSEITTDSVRLAELPLLPEDLASAPLRSSPLRSSPLRSSTVEAAPLRSSPLRSSPLRSSPLRSSPLRSSPLRSSPLRSSPFISALPLSTVPLLDGAGGWAARLADPTTPTPYAGLPLQSVTLQQVLDLDPATYPQLADLTLADIDLTTTPLRSSSIQGFLFSGVTLQQLSPTTAWCTLIDCGAPDPDIDPAVHGLLDVELAGLTIPSTVAGLPVAEATLTGSVIANWDLASVDVSWTAFASVPANDTRLTGLIDCTNPGFDCGSKTLTDAIRSSADADTSTPDVITQSATLAPILADDTLTGWTTFGDLIRALIDPARLSFADIPLDAVVPFAPYATSHTYSVSFQARCDDADGYLNVAVSLPDGFRYVPGTGSYTVGGGTAVAAEPYDPASDSGDAVLVGDHELVAPTFGGGAVPPEGSLQWLVGGVSCPEGATEYVPIEVDLGVQSGARLGTVTASALVLTESLNASAVSDPHAVLERFEPNDGDVATPVRPGVLYLSHIGTPGDVDHFEIAPQPDGSIVTVVLSHVPADYDLFFVEGPVSSPLRSSPLRSSPLRSSPLRSSPLRSSPLEDEGLESDVDGEVIAPDTLQDLPLRSSPLRSSANRGTEDEVVSAVVMPGGGSTPLTVAVTGYNGASSDQPYLLQVLIEPPPQLACPPNRDLEAVGSSREHGTLGTPAASVPDPTTVADTTRTLFLVNGDRSGDLYGDAAVDGALANVETLRQRPEVAGIVVDVSGATAVRDAYVAWDADPCSIAAVNGVVSAIADLVLAYQVELPNLENVVILGGDDEIPHARVPDLVTLSNQRDYFFEVRFDSVDNPLSAAFAQSHGLSDNAYGAGEGYEWLGHTLVVPELATGRLVETPADWNLAIARYETSPQITLGDSLSAGYDFLADMAQAVDGTLSAVVGDPNAQTLISGDGDAVDEDWSRQALVDALGLGPDVAMVGAHFDHSNALPAKGDVSAAAPDATDLFTSSDLAAIGGLPPGFLLITPGCNSAINVPNHVFLGATPEQAERLQDFVQTMAARTASGTVGNLGYGYGDTAAIAYSERLLDLYVEELAGGATLGQALVDARLRFLSELGLPSVYDEKVATEVIFYGLPFTGTTVTPSTTGTTATTSALSPAIDASTGIQAATFDVTPTFETVTKPDGTYPTVAGSQPLLAHYRPVQPMTVLDLPAPPDGTQLGDVWFTGLTSTDAPVANPVYVRPRVDESRVEPEPDVRDVAFPAALANTTFGGDLALLAGSFRTDDSGTGGGSQRLYQRMAGKVFFPTAADTRPTIFEVHATDGGTSTTFEAVVADADEVVAAYQVAGDPVWSFVSLTSTGGGTWTGTVGELAAEFFVQARNGGMTGYAKGKGLNYVPTAAGTDITFQGDGGPQWFSGPVTATVTGPDGPYTLSIDGGPRVASPTQIDGDGSHTVEAFDVNGALVATEIVHIDTVAPAVNNALLTPNPIPVTGSTELTATVIDAVSGAAGGDYRLDGGTPVAMAVAGDVLKATISGLPAGVFKVEVRATDGAGHTSGWFDGGLLAVYDPDGGFVTGGGWIDSPAGAYRADVDLTGRANFGFVSKYQKGAATPSGKTEFQFKAGDFRFYSETYQWLVVSGHKAQYKGTGSVNGVPGYGFLLTAYDGQATGGDGSDRFRLKVWELVTEQVVYDNAYGASDDIDDAKPQPISGGSIVIHKKK